MFKLTIAVLATAALVGCASVDDMGEAQGKIGALESQVSLLEAKVGHIEATQNDIEQRRRPAVSYCYLNGERYTEGAVVSGRICQRSGIQTTGQPPNVSWRPNT